MSGVVVRHLVLVMRRPGFDAGLLPAHAAFLDVAQGAGVARAEGVGAVGVLLAHVARAVDLAVIARVRNARELIM